MENLNIVKDLLDLRDIMYCNRHLINIELLPANIDLREKCSPIVDQSNLGSCTANAVVSGLREYILINSENSPLIRLSRIYVCWWEKLLSDANNKNSFISLRDGMKILHKIGVCTETTRPYDIDNVTIAPTALENTEAKKYAIPGYQRLSSIDDIKHALFNNHLVVFSMNIYKSFKSSVGNDGLVPIPSLNKQIINGHAMCIVGYNDHLYGGSFIVRNSYGSAWGDKGYCYIPYTMTKYIMDVWTVKFSKNLYLY